MNYKKEIIVTQCFITVAVVATALLVSSLVSSAWHSFVFGDYMSLLQIGIFSFSVFFISYGSFLYLFCRLQDLKKVSQHKPIPMESLLDFYSKKSPSLAVLVPSYKEERDVIIQTVVSAALSEYPSKEVVLLVDDPYNPKLYDDRKKLEETREIPFQLQKMFDSMRAGFQFELIAFRQRINADEVEIEQERLNLARLYEEAAECFEKMADWFVADMGAGFGNHVHKFFVNRMLKAPAERHRKFSKEIVDIRNLTLDGIHKHYSRLASLFNTKFSSFERKKYQNLSHESNKAMNLNGYISVMGNSYRERMEEDGLHLDLAAPESADISFNKADYIITLDADSMIEPDYALRLVYEMERPMNSNMAVIQTPYTAYPDAPNMLERVAGASTDVQFGIHQGLTEYNATFWGGANACLRRSALNDICETKMERGYPVKIFIQNRTVIEDTESSIDLVYMGWKLCNYPERLAYSATPPDFGSLLIQRRRWANGGLLLVPKLIKSALKTPKSFALLKEFLLRFHHLTALTTGTIATLLLLFYPFPDKIASLWMLIAAIPCFVLYARDLKFFGYKYSDMFRIYSLTLMLIPVVIGGVLKSIEQAITKEKIPFGRTPKVPGRTSAPLIYCLAEVAMPAVCVVMFFYDVYVEKYAHASFAALNGSFFFYAYFQYIGWKNNLEDMVASIKSTKWFAASSAELPKLEEKILRPLEVVDFESKKIA